jgi:hypothetical protein
MPLGCFTNCFPAALPARFARVVAAYSAELRLLIAASGRYRSPVLLDGLPLLVLHFWSPQAFNDCCGALSAIAVTPKILKIFYGVTQDGGAVFKHSKRTIALFTQNSPEFARIVIVVDSAVDQSHLTFADGAAAFLPFITIYKLFRSDATTRTPLS